MRIHQFHDFCWHSVSPSHVRGRKERTKALHTSTLEMLIWLPTEKSLCLWAISSSFCEFWWMHAQNIRDWGPRRSKSFSWRLLLMRENGSLRNHQSLYRWGWNGILWKTTLEWFMFIYIIFTSTFSRFFLEQKLKRRKGQNVEWCHEWLILVC